jgi:tetratricopeptide (TPR) repeat protein
LSQALAHKKSLMKKETRNILFYLALTHCSFQIPIQAADFSRAKQTVVPPSYIRRDLDAFGTENLGSVSKIQGRVSSLINSGQLGEAENIARGGLKIYPNSSILKNQFARITALEAQRFLQSQNFDSAGKKARESLVADPNNKTAKSVVGQVLQSQGLNPNSDEGHVKAGDALASEGRLLEASVEYKLALEIKPNAAAHVGLGNIAIGKGEITEAHRHFERAVAIDPNSALAYRQRGALRYVLKDAVGANSDFSRAVSLNPNDQVAAEALVGLWKQQVAASPNAANSHLGLARAYMQTNNLEAARGEYKTVVALNPTDPSLPAARASFKLALAKQEADQCVQGARTLDLQGALNEAHQKLVEAVAYCPNDPQILMYNAQICERLGLGSEARDAYMTVLKYDPKNLEAASRLKMLGNNNLIPELASPGVLNIRISPQAQFPPVAPSCSTSEQPIQVTPSPASFTLSPSLPPAPALNTPPLPDENLQNAPLKSPIPPKTQKSSQAQFGDAYYSATENVYIGDPAQVTMLGNFGSCVRALMMAQKHLLQTANSAEFSNNRANSESNNNSWF